MLKGDLFPSDPFRDTEKESKAIDGDSQRDEEDHFSYFMGENAKPTKQDKHCACVCNHEGLEGFTLETNGPDRIFVFIDAVWRKIR